MKEIKIQWVKALKTPFNDGMEMRVIESNHERFSVGSRFDYGFFNIATKEGYKITSYPIRN